MLFNRLALFGAVPIFIILAVLAFLSFRFAQNERAEQSWVTHTYQVKDAIEAVRSDTERAEAAERGFLLTRDDTYLSSYRVARATVIPDITLLRRLTLDNSSEQVRVGKIEALMRKRFEVMEQLLAIGAPPDLFSPRSMQLMEAGRSDMDNLQSLLAAATAEENGLLIRRSAVTQMFEENVGWAALVGALLALGLFFAAAMLLARNNAQLARAESLRAHQANVLQATLDSIRDGIAVFETDGSLAAFNLNFFHMLQFPPTLAHIGAKLGEFRAVDEERGSGIFAKLAPVDERDVGFKRLTFADREIDLYRAVVPKDGFVAVAADVTARVRSEAALRQAQKMEAIGQLTGGVAHDFNNLLQIIGANLDLVAPDLRGNPQSSSRLQNAIAAVERASRLTTQLLAFARRQALEPRSINPGRLILDMTELLRRTLGEQIEVESIIAGGLWNTQVDANQLQNAMLNLAVNARDAMPNGGKLTIEAANAFLDDDYAQRHSEVVPGQYVLIAVSDTGHGMPADVIARAFDPFFTTKPEGRGTGLGLSQVYGFVKQSGGHIKIYSEMGHGTTVKLYLPRTGKPLELPDSHAGTPAKGGGETILVVEDDEGVRAAVGDMLIELGYGVLKAEDAEQALAVLKGGAKIDLLFTDVVMPGPIRTRELARMALDLHPDMKILFTSGYTQNAIVHNGRLDNDVFLLSKPYRKDELARKLRSLLEEPGARAEPEPIVQTELQPSPEARDETKIAALRKALVVEDIALIRMTTVDMLSELGLESAEAGDGKSALEALSSDPDIGVMLADLGLPGMTGKELVAQVRKTRPDLKIVIASGGSASDLGDDISGVVFLAKPFDLDQLRRALLQV